MFSEELQYFIDHQDELVRKYRGKVLAIKGQRVLGAYASALKAYLATQAKHEPGTFMLQPCEPGPEAYTITLTPSIAAF
jgi:hypothetical protein